MKKITCTALAVVLSSSFVMVSAQKTKQDSAKTTDIEGVVVTALGIKREKKALGYASQEVKAEALFSGTTNTGNISDALSGKVAGLQINSNSNFGGSTNMVIRGIKTLSPGSGPLVVIDGSPVNNSATYTGNMNGGVDYGNGLADINQEDIESINVLKGAAASALYGEKGLNGVILITTKNGKGKEDNSWGVTLNSSVQAGFIDKSTFPTYQTKYGEGYYDPTSKAGWWAYGTTNGVNNANFGDDASWGPAFNPNLLVRQWDSFDPTSPNYGKATPWVAAKNGPIKFFDTPVSYINSITLSKGQKGNNFLLSWDNNKSNGLLPNSDMNKNTITGKINYDLTSKLHATVFTTLTVQNTQGRNGAGYNDNIISGFRQWWPVNVDLISLRDAYERNIAAPSAANNYGNVTWNRNSATDGTPAFWNNPYFQRYQSYNSDTRTRTWAYAQLVYDIDKHVNILGKASYDNTSVLIENRLAVGSYPNAMISLSGKNANSGYYRWNFTNRLMNFDLMANFKYDITSDIGFTGTAGGAMSRSDYNSIQASTEGGLNIPNIYSLANSKGAMLAPVENQYRTMTTSAYALASFDFYKIFYLDGSVRRDKSSVLPANNNAYTYWSVSGSLIMSELLKLQGGVVDFWKIRGNYATVGGAGLPYQLGYSYNTYAVYGSTAVITPPTSYPNPNLKPQNSKEYEVGTEIQMFKNRVSFDGAYYNTRTFDQILALSISAGSGQNTAVVNAGRIDNKGVELHLGLVPIKSKDFTWSLDANWSKNINKVVALTPDVKTYSLVSMVGGTTVVAKEGHAWGDIVGTDYVYLNGQKVVDPTTGLYLKSDNTQTIGNVMPKWLGGLRNTFTYKGLSLSFLIDVRHGGDIYSSDLYYGLASGMYPETAVDGYRTAVKTLPGVNPNGQTNTTPVAAAYNPAGYTNNVGDSYSWDPNKRFVYDGSFVKLREASITYNLPKSLLANTFINEAKVGIVGRNLWIIHKNLPYADPESTQMGGLYAYGNSIGTLPTTREIGVNVTFKF